MCSSDLSACTMKFKVFAWLLVKDRLNTKDLLKQRHWDVTENHNCALCPVGAYEDRQHLFFTCNFSQRVWNYLQIFWIQSNDIQISISQARKEFAKPFVMEVIIVACRHIWLQRNGFIFEHIRPSFVNWKRGFVHDLTLSRYRMKTKLADGLIQWIAELP